MPANRARADEHLPDGVVRKLRIPFEDAETGHQEPQQAHLQDRRQSALEPLLEATETEENLTARRPSRCVPDDTAASDLTMLVMQKQMLVMPEFDEAGIHFTASQSSSCSSSAQPQSVSQGANQQRDAKFVSLSQMRDDLVRQTAVRRPRVTQRACSSPAQLRAGALARSRHGQADADVILSEQVRYRRRESYLQLGYSPDDTAIARSDDANDSDAWVHADALVPVDRETTNGSINNSIPTSLQGAFGLFSPPPKFTPSRCHTSPSANSQCTTSSPGLQLPAGTWGAGEFEDTVESQRTASAARPAEAPASSSLFDCPWDSHPVSQLVAKAVASSICETLRTVAPSCCAMCGGCAMCQACGGQEGDATNGTMKAGQAVVGGRFARVSIGEVVVGTDSPRPRKILATPLKESSAEYADSDVDDQAFDTPPDTHQRVTSSQQTFNYVNQKEGFSPISGSGSVPRENSVTFNARSLTDSVPRENCRRDEEEEDRGGPHAVFPTKVIDEGTLQRESCNFSDLAAELEGLCDDAGPTSRTSVHSNTSSGAHRFVPVARNPGLYDEYGHGHAENSATLQPPRVTSTTGFALGNSPPRRQMGRSPGNQHDTFRTPSVSCSSEWSAANAKADDDDERMAMPDEPTIKLGFSNEPSARSQSFIVSSQDARGRGKDDCTRKQITDVVDAWAPRMVASYLADLGMSPGVATAVSTATQSPFKTDSGKPARRRVLASQGPQSANMGDIRGPPNTSTAFQFSAAPVNLKSCKGGTRGDPPRKVFFPDPPVHASQRMYHEGHHQTWTPRNGCGLTPRQIPSDIIRRGGA